MKKIVGMKSAGDARAETGKLVSARAKAIAAVALASLAFGGAVLAQNLPRGETVTWTAAPVEARPGAKVKLVLQGQVQSGWHVYGLKQLENGPTEMRVALDPTALAKAEGGPLGSAPVKFHDPAFDLQTQYYEKPFTVALPVRVAAKAPAGRQTVPLSVRFQTCNGAICQPPKTVKVSAVIDVKGAG